MSHSNTVLSQLLKFVRRHEFEQLVNQHHSGRSFRAASRWSQFFSLLLMAKCKTPTSIKTPWSSQQSRPSS
ncbi:MAG: DUF4372 domain-containing protein [Arenicella sp.]|nr:DUF4372 domain-containing protein [Arenicella sp.]